MALDELKRNIVGWYESCREINWWSMVGMGGMNSTLHEYDQPMHDYDPPMHDYDRMLYASWEDKVME